MEREEQQKTLGILKAVGDHQKEEKVLVQQKKVRVERNPKGTITEYSCSFLAIYALSQGTHVYFMFYGAVYACFEQWFFGKFG